MTKYREDLSTFGGRLRAARNAKGWNQTELGNRVTRDLKTIGRYERGEVMPDSVKIVEDLAEVLGVHYPWLASGVGPREKGDAGAGGEAPGAGRRGGARMIPFGSVGTDEPIEVRTEGGGEGSGGEGSGDGARRWLPVPGLAIQFDLNDQPWFEFTEMGMRVLGVPRVNINVRGGGQVRPPGAPETGS